MPLAQLPSYVKAVHTIKTHFNNILSHTTKSDSPLTKSLCLTTAGFLRVGVLAALMTRSAASWRHIPNWTAAATWDWCNRQDPSTKVPEIWKLSDMFSGPILNFHQFRTPPCCSRCATTVTDKHAASTIRNGSHKRRSSHGLVGTSWLFSPSGTQPEGWQRKTSVVLPRHFRSLCVPPVYLLFPSPTIYVRLFPLLLSSIRVVLTPSVLRFLLRRRINGVPTRWMRGS